MRKVVAYQYFLFSSFTDSINASLISKGAGSVLSNKDDAKMNKTVDPSLLWRSSQSIRGETYK